MSFKDHFSAHASLYAEARPRYPDALFQWLAAQSPNTALAWDAGCGNGQASIALARYFDRVIGTDPSAAQIAAAEPAARVEYRVEPAEQPSLADGSVDLVTVAQAFHWFDLPRFHAAVARVLRPGGVLAVWSYGLCRVTTEIDALFDRLYEPVLGPFWPAERHHVENGYRELSFPLPELTDMPAFAMQPQWTLAQYLAYLRTWSAVQRYIAARGTDPVAELADAFAAAWGDPAQVRAVNFPLRLRVGRKATG